jgi:hypothetical protein
MKENLTKYDTGVIRGDYTEQAKLIASGKKGIAFAHEHGKTVGTLIGFFHPTLWESIRYSVHPEMAPRLQVSQNALMIAAEALEDEITIRKNRSRWTALEKAAFLTGIFVKSGPAAVFFQQILPSAFRNEQRKTAGK